MKKLLSATLFAATLSISMNSNATIITEGDDVGARINNHGDAGLIAPWATTQIDGKLGIGADLWEFDWIGGELTITTVDTTDWTKTNPLDDSQLFLFDENGYGIAANDDISSSNWLSILSFDYLDSGTYLLGIAPLDIDPLNKFGNEIFPDDPWTDQVSPITNNIMLSSWDKDSYDAEGKRYSVVFETNIPEPSVLALFALGFAGLGFAKRRQKHLA